eukprot:10957-Rhodomonas_salina.1
MSRSEHVHATPMTHCDHDDSNDDVFGRNHDRSHPGLRLMQLVRTSAVCTHLESSALPRRPHFTPH